MGRKLQKGTGDTRHRNGSADTMADDRSKAVVKNESGRKNKATPSTPKRVDWEKAWTRTDGQKWDLMRTVRDGYQLLFDMADKDLNESTPKERQLHQITTRVVAAFLKKAYDEAI